MNPDTNSLLSNDAVSIEPVPPPRPSLLRRTFVGADGLRAGWSLLLFILMFGGTLFTVMKIVMKMHKPSGNHAPEVSWQTMLLNEVIPFLAVALITWIMSKIERRPNSVYGLGGMRKAALFFAGLGWGFACLTLLFAILWRGGLLVIDSRMLYGFDVVRYCAIWLVGFLFVGLLEEYLTRGYMQYTLTRGLAGLYRSLFKTRHSEALGFWTVALAFSILFGMGHSRNPGRIAARSSLRRRRRIPVLLQPVAYRIAVVGHRIPHFVGLVAVLPVRRRRQRHDGAASPAGDASRGQADPERRHDRPRR